MSNSIPVHQAYKVMQDTIKRFPKLKNELEDAFDLMRQEIDDGEGEDLEVDRFYNYMVELSI